MKDQSCTTTSLFRRLGVRGVQEACNHFAGKRREDNPVAARHSMMQARHRLLHASKTKRVEEGSRRRSIVRGKSQDTQDGLRIHLRTAKRGVTNTWMQLSAVLIGSEYVPYGIELPRNLGTHRHGRIGRTTFNNFNLSPEMPPP